MEKIRKMIYYSSKTEIEILNSARLGTDYYDFDSIKLL